MIGSPAHKTPSFYVIVALVGLVIFFLLREFAFIRLLDQAHEQARIQVHAVTAPLPARASMSQCLIYGLSDSESQAVVQASGVHKSALAVISYTEPKIQTASNALLATCAERFVLDGGTVDEMLARANMIQMHLSDEFLASGLAAVVREAP